MNVLESTMIETLRLRSLHLVGIIMISLLLSPTPINLAAINQLKAARTAASAGEIDSALIHMEKVLEYYPDNIRYRISVAEMAFVAGEYNRALHHLSAFKDNVQFERDLICMQAESLLALQNPAQALEFWELADYQCPNFLQNLRPLVEDFIQEEDFDQAEQILRIMSEVQPQDVDVQFLLGMVIATYAPEEALTSLRLADDLSHHENLLAQQLYRTIEDARAFDHAAYTLACVGKYFAVHAEWIFAVRTFENAVLIQSDYAEAYAYLGLSKDNMEMNGIVELLKAIELAPDLPLPHIIMGMHWLIKSKDVMAMNEFERALELDPDNPAIIAQVGAVYEAKDEIQNALEAYRAAAQINPQNPDFWLLLAQKSLKYEFEVSEIALPAARNALVLNPLYAPALDAMGYSYFLLGDMNFAEKYLHRAVESDPSLASAQYHMGLLMFHQDESEAAIAALKLAQELDSDGDIGFLARRSLETILP
jgi:tetratricopeptide (TPR) repeat protein